MKKINNEILRRIFDTSSPYNPSYDYDANDALDGAVELARMLLYSASAEGEVIHQSKHASDFDKWYDEQSYKNQRAISVWLTHASIKDDLYIFRQFNRQKHIREIFDLFLAQQPYPPYLNNLHLNMIKQMSGLSNDAMAAIDRDQDRLYARYDDLYANKNAIIDWIANIPQPIRFYAGKTNTTLGQFDADLVNLPVKKDYDAFFDIGGEFNTSEMNRLIGRKFTSLDPVSPMITDYDGRLIIKKKAAPNVAYCINDAEMDRYLESQRQVPWIKFDISAQQIPPDHASYFLMSTGFLTSTVKLSKQMEEDWCSERIDAGFRYVVTSLIGIHRIIELVKTGKPVQLLSISRATSRFYHHRAVLLEWKEGCITSCHIVPNQYVKGRYLKKFNEAVS